VDRCRLYLFRSGSAIWRNFIHGRRWPDRQAADNQRRSVEAELLAARNRLVATVTETYCSWLQALDFIHVAEAALEAARTDEQLGEARLAAEIALPSEVLHLKTQTAEQHGNLVTAKTSARRLQAALERLITRPIFLTSMTVMLAAWPITLDPIFSGLAWALIFGVFISTLFTLVVVPVVYYMAYARRFAREDEYQS